MLSLTVTRAINLYKILLRLLQFTDKFIRTFSLFLSIFIYKICNKCKKRSVHLTNV